MIRSKEHMRDKKSIRRDRAISLILGMAFLQASCGSDPITGSSDTFMDKHDLQLSKQGEFSFMTGQHDGEADQGEFQVHSNIVISEAPSETKAEYKEVTATIISDVSGSGDLKYSLWHSAFDMYTGTSFEFTGESPVDGAENLGNVSFDYNGRTYDVTMLYEVEFDEEKQELAVTIKVTCPADYNGTVFQVGYSDLAITDMNHNVDYASRLHTLDELPGFNTNGHEYFYFSYDIR